MKTVYVGMSGGVDSSVTAALLKQQGFNVVGVYMKNWTQDFAGLPCTWKEDYRDAKRVAVQLGIDFRVYDFEKEYKHKVVDYMLAEYQAGRTPNPDVMCNQEVKFKLFLETALGDGADMIATGHYAKIVSVNGLSELRVALNAEKDQTYFLYRITSEALSKTLMPIGNIKTKADVRALARKLGLATSEKKDSQGICFVGKVGIKEFLSQYISTKPGEIIDQHNKIIGQHDGAIFYTIGQRHGLDVGGGLPYYVAGKDMKANQVFVTTDLQDSRLWHDEIELTDVHWINDEPKRGVVYHIRTRYRAALVKGTLQLVSSKSKNLQNTLHIALSEQIRAITPGQSAVIYDGDNVLGGGIVI